MFYSILFPTREQYERPLRTEPPDCFKDLNLDQVFSPILKSKKEFGLEGFFYTSLSDREIIVYRQDVMKDLEDDDLRGQLADFSRDVHALGGRMETIVKALASEDSSDNNYLTKGRLLDCADRYRREISSLAEKLGRAGLRSRGLRGFAGYLLGYRDSEEFRGLAARVGQLREELSTVKYNMLVKSDTIRVRKYEGEEDHSKQILAVFEKFRQGGVQDYRQPQSEEPYAAHVEAAVLDLVARLYKDIFSDLDAFCGQSLNILDETVARFSRDIQFYLSWLELIRPLQEAGLLFNDPELCDTAERLYDLGGFDLALALQARGQTVTNDFKLDAPERILVVTGPNQGGKTTFARAFGQQHWLASLGLRVPGRKAALYLFDRIFTHFGREEDLSTLNGKLQDDLVRLHGILKKATGRSILIVNEIFSSTTLSDALLLGGHMMDAVAALGAPAVVVTFLDELASHGPETVSMMSTVREDDPAQRTYKIVRKPPDGLAYAMYLAGKHGLTYEQLDRRLKR